MRQMAPRCIGSRTKPCASTDVIIAVAATAVNTTRYGDIFLTNDLDQKNVTLFIGRFRPTF